MQVTNRRVSRVQCSNCTCSPGLLSRTNKRSSWFTKQINLKRNLQGSSASRTGSRKGSVFTIDASSLCLPEDAKEFNTSKRLSNLRLIMKDYNLGIYIVPSEDEHQLEYVSPIDQKRSFISGFQGSAGVAIVTRDVTSLNEQPEGLAALSTDSRYFNQAINELDFNWNLLKRGSDIDWENWTINQAIQLSLDSGDKINIGVDPKLINYKLYQKLNNIIKSELLKFPKADIELIPIIPNLIDKIWSKFEDLPIPKSDSIIKVLDDSFTGESISSKINKVFKYLKNSNANGLIISSLDEIAWLLNLRGNDIEYNPVFYSYLIITDDNKITLFVDNLKFDTTIHKILTENGIIINQYNQFWNSLNQLTKNFSNNNKKILINPISSSWEIIRNLKCDYEFINISPIADLKSIKNDIELDGARRAHLKDGKSLIKFFSWLENELINKSELIDEYEADIKLTQLRKQEDNFVGLSFKTISATGPNSSVVHYTPSILQNSVIDPNNIYLCDSGSQFLDGTTDVTRTFHFGFPSIDQIKNYTLVLKGNLALGMLKFPTNLTGNSIDSIARQFLWNYGLDYGHGTSHGIGSYLNVHEGPVGIGPKSINATLKPGQIISNEPGYYKDGEYGIRIENVMIVKSSPINEGFLEFETITKVPLCKKLIDRSLLNVDEIKWINNYHNSIWTELSPFFDKNGLEYNWLKKSTTPL